MQSISALKCKHSGTPAFVLGNGYSRLFYNVPLLKDKGILMGCNRAFQEYPDLDYLGFRDDPEVPVCLKWPGTKLTHERNINEIGGIGRSLDNMKGEIYSWIYCKDDGKKPGAGEVVKGSTGVIMAQIAVHMGCEPIILVGCDCCRFDGFTSSNACYDDAHIKQVQATLNKFKTQFHKFRDRHKDKKIYKLGDHGVLEFPVITMLDIMRGEAP